MYEVRQTATFHRWLETCPDRRAAARVAQRIVRLEAGLFGDARSVGGEVRELRIDYGPGYRLYFVQRGKALVVLLCGGDKKSQARDIRLARSLAAGLEDT